MVGWVAERIEQSGYAGIALLMFLENLFPPIPSELIMPLSGFVAARGDLSLAAVVLAGTAGSVGGALFWYAIGRWVGDERIRRWSRRHGRWAAIRPRDVDAAIAWFERHCAKAVFLGRLVPAVRTLISVPAGIAAMPLPTFVLYSTLGTTLWSGLLGTAGYLLEDEYAQVSHYLNPISAAILGLMAIWYVVRVVTSGRRDEETSHH